MTLILDASAAKSLQSCPTLCDPIDGSPPGSPVPGILQARTLEWVAISSSNAWKWKEKVKSLSRVQLVVTPSTAAYQAPPSMDFPGKSTGVECHCLLPDTWWILVNNVYGLSIWVCLMFSHDSTEVICFGQEYHRGDKGIRAYMILICFIFGDLVSFLWSYYFALFLISNYLKEILFEFMQISCFSSDLSTVFSILWCTYIVNFLLWAVLTISRPIIVFWIIQYYRDIAFLLFNFQVDG